MDVSRYFDKKELICQCGCETCEMQPHFLEALDQLREDWGKPIVLSSAYRCPDYNDKISSSGRDGSHVLGVAADIRIDRKNAYELLKLAIPRFNGIGINQKGTGRFIHLDLKTGNLRPTIWSY